MNMDLSFLNEFVVVFTLACCIGIGYIVKTSLNFIPNKYIPLIMGIVGICFNCYAAAEVNATTIVAGLITGLASTGTHELFKNFIEKK